MIAKKSGASNENVDERKRGFSSTDCVSNEIELSLKMIENDNNSNSHRVATVVDDGENNMNSVVRNVFDSSIKL